MAYAMADLELTQPLPELILGPEEHGLFLLFRLQGRPIHYSMHTLAPGAHLAPADFHRLGGLPLVDALLEDALRAELRPPVKIAPVELTVAICTRARPDLLGKCLRSVLALRSDARDFEVIVIDNDPPDDSTERLVRSLPEVRYVREPRPGLDFARNRALAEAKGRWTAFLDDDVIADRGWLGGLERAVAEHPDAACVTGLVLAAELLSDAQIIFERRGGFGHGCRPLRFSMPAPENPLFPLGAGIFGAGCNMVLRTDVVRALGGFDIALDTGPPLPGGGDLDIWSRIIRAGHPLVYEPSMLVFHRHRVDYASLRRQYWSWGESFMAYLTKTARTDPSQRRRATSFVRWWLGYHNDRLVASLRSRDDFPADLVLVELIGGLVGLAGSYGRSQRRVKRIHLAHG